MFLLKCAIITAIVSLSAVITAILSLSVINSGISPFSFLMQFDLAKCDLILFVRSFNLLYMLFLLCVCVCVYNTYILSYFI